MFFCFGKRLLVPALLFILSAVAGCSDQSERKGAAESLILYGNVDIREVQLAFQDAGRIRNLAVDEGAKVKKGQVVAELDPARFQMDADRLGGEVMAQTDRKSVV